MNHEQEQDEKIQKLQEQNKKMKKRLLIVGGTVVAVILLLVALIAILQACDAANDSGVELPEEYFHPAHQGDIFAYPAYLDKSPEVIMYCASPNGMGRITQIDRETPDTYPETVIYLYDFLQIMMRGDVEAYNDCFNQAYYKKHQPKTALSAFWRKPNIRATACGPTNCATSCLKMTAPCAATWEAMPLFLCTSPCV